MAESKDKLEDYQSFIDGHLKRFISDKEVESVIIELIEAGSSRAEIYRIVSSGKGVPKSHASGKYKEGELKHS